MNLKYSLGWLLKNTKGSQYALCQIVLLGILRVVCGLGFIYVTKELIDHVTDAENVGLIRYAILLALLMPGGIVLNALSGWLSSLTEVNVENRLRMHLFEQALGCQYDEQTTMHTGDTQSRLITDVRIVSHFLTISLPLLLTSGVQLVASFLFLKNLDAWLAWLVILSMIVFFISGRMYSKRMRKLTHEVRMRESKIVSFTQERLQYRTLIKTLEQVPEQIKALIVLQSDLVEHVKDRTQFSVCSKTVLALGFGCGYLCTLLFGAVQLHKGLITFGVMTAYLQLVGQVQRPIAELTRLIPLMVTTLASTDRLIELELTKREDQHPAVFLDGILGLRLKNVCFGYSESNILNNLSYDFKPGSITTIIGETGTGKTTLIRLLLALIGPEMGTVMLYNERQEQKVSEKTRVNFVYVPQGNTLLSGTIRDNLLLGNPMANDEDMTRALYIAAAEFVYQLPQGLNTLCGEQGGGLSEGQAQRVAIARALLRPGAILLLDEITSSLDRETEMKLIKRLTENAENKTIIFVTHSEYIPKGSNVLNLSCQ